MSIQSIGSRGPTFAVPAETQVAARQTQSPQSDNTQVGSEKESSSPQQLQEAVQSMNDFAAGTLNSSLNFSVDTETGKTIVKVMDSETKEVLKQIPSEEMVAIAKAVDKLKGLLVHQKA